MMGPVYVYNGSPYVVTGYYNYNGDTNASVIHMFMNYSFVKITIEVKTDYGWLYYHLERLVDGEWVEVGSINSTLRTGAILDIWVDITPGDYRLRIENPYNWFERPIMIEVWWYAIA